jgi:preprotein translocase subunit SecE
MGNFTKLITDAKQEISKVIFPLKSQVKTAFISVVVVVTFISLFLALVDLIMSSTLSVVLGINS